MMGSRTGFFTPQGVVIGLPQGRGHLNADLTLPEACQGLVIFAHGSGSSRFSPRNRFVASRLNQAGLATLLADLLTEPEDREDAVTLAFRFNIALLAERLRLVTDWARSAAATRDLSIGYFGASTGAAAALIAAQEGHGIVQAVVSRGGRPDLAERSLSGLHCPTLFIVGGHDPDVLALNRRAGALLPSRTVQRLEVIPGAGHLFEEPGALERVADLAAGWFRDYLPPRVGSQPTG